MSPAGLPGPSPGLTRRGRMDRQMRGKVEGQMAQSSRGTHRQGHYFRMEVAVVRMMTSRTVTPADRTWHLILRLWS